MNKYNTITVLRKKTKSSVHCHIEIVTIYSLIEAKTKKQALIMAANGVISTHPFPQWVRIGNDAVEVKDGIKP